MTFKKQGHCARCGVLIAATRPLGAPTAELIAITHAAARGPRNCAGSRKPVKP